uniref:Uncharacterized protein n=1 Tax=Plectus sambesii TaxID=2011161 RepID=A0A914WXZ1_9BILA
MKAKRYGARAPTIAAATSAAQIVSATATNSKADPTGLQYMAPAPEWSIGAKCQHGEGGGRGSADRDDDACPDGSLSGFLRWLRTLCLLLDFFE